MNNANANAPHVFRCNRPNCQFERQNLTRLTEHIRPRDDHGIHFGSLPNRPGQCNGVHIIMPLVAGQAHGEAYVLIAKETVTPPTRQPARHWQFGLSRRNGAICSLVTDRLCRSDTAVTTLVAGEPLLNAVGDCS
ncbi:hypothetical protein niasHT_010213 [Heterodera trifolii]|uniref:Uncharacterized protein n=1 Tax=Heterodera trifolii TaxID=157864 RepID=A0ABD2MDM5_9BILA